MNSEPAHFLTLMNNGMTAPSQHAATSVLTNSRFYQSTGKPKGPGFLQTLRNTILLEHNSS